MLLEWDSSAQAKLVPADRGRRSGVAETARRRAARNRAALSSRGSLGDRGMSGSRVVIVAPRSLFAEAPRDDAAMGWRHSPLRAVEHLCVVAVRSRQVVQAVDQHPQPSVVAA